MKIRLTLLTENNQPVSALGDNAEEKVRLAWEWFLREMMKDAPTNNDDKVSVEKVEIVDDQYESTKETIEESVDKFWENIDGMLQELK